MNDVYIQNLIDRYKSIDPQYGSQQHQRDFIGRVREMQLRAPCTKDHSGDSPPEHRYSGKDACYPTKVIEEIAAQRKSYGPIS